MTRNPTSPCQMFPYQIGGCASPSQHRQPRQQRRRQSGSEDDGGDADGDGGGNGGEVCGSGLPPRPPPLTSLLRRRSPRKSTLERIKAQMSPRSTGASATTVATDPSTVLVATVEVRTEEDDSNGDSGGSNGPGVCNVYGSSRNDRNYGSGCNYGGGFASIPEIVADDHRSDSLEHHHHHHQQQQQQQQREQRHVSFSSDSPSSSSASKESKKEPEWYYQVSTSPRFRSESNLDDQDRDDEGYEEEEEEERDGRSTTVSASRSRNSRWRNCNRRWTPRKTKTNSGGGDKPIKPQKQKGGEGYVDVMIPVKRQEEIELALAFHPEESGSLAEKGATLSTPVTSAATASGGGGNGTASKGPGASGTAGGISNQTGVTAGGIGNQTSATAATSGGRGVAAAATTATLTLTSYVSNTTTTTSSSSAAAGDDDVEEVVEVEISENGTDKIINSTSNSKKYPFLGQDSGSSGRGGGAAAARAAADMAFKSDLPSSSDYSLYDGSTLTDITDIGKISRESSDTIPAIGSLPASLKQRALLNSGSTTEDDDEEEEEEEEEEEADETADKTPTSLASKSQSVSGKSSTGSKDKVQSKTNSQNLPGQRRFPAVPLGKKQQEPQPQPQPQPRLPTSVQIEEPDTTRHSNTTAAATVLIGKLHEICENATTLEELLQANDHLSAAAAASTDINGRTPLHMISLNHNLSQLVYSSHHHHQQELNNANSRHDDSPISLRRSMSDSVSTHSTNEVEEQLVDFVVTKLWKAYRPAMITPDRLCYIPFQEELVEWIQCIYYQSMMRHASTRASQKQNSFWAKSSRSIRGPWSANTIPTDNTSPTRDVECPGSPGGAGMASFQRTNSSASYPIARVSSHVLFCFKMLSAMIDRMDRRLEWTGKNKKRRQKQAQNRAASVRNEGDHFAEEDGDGGFQMAVDELRDQTVADVDAEIVQSIASIPDLVKTVLLIEDEHQRSYILSTSIMRRVLASKYSIGSWLTQMLQSPNKRASDRAIEYLQFVSDPDLFETKRSDSSWRRSKKNLRSSVSGSSTSRKHGGGEEELYNEISRLQEFVPSLLSLGEWEMEEAVSTRLVTKVLDHLISRPFAATVVLCDAIFLSILITGLRLAVNHLLVGRDNSKVVNYLYLANIGEFYYIIRELGKAVSLLMMTKRVRVYIWSFWNITDFLSTILAAVSIVAIRAFVVDFGPDQLVSNNLRNVVAVATGFLWLRVLSFLKGINMQLATFVLAILQITRDVLWFCVILLTLVVSFAQMFFTLLAPESCAYQEQEEVDYNRACTPSEYYLSVYSILLGDFGLFQRESFVTVFAVVLAVFFSFIVVLVLLNVLIAVASDSYEKCLMRSRKLFGRARVMLIAEMVSFQNLLRRNADETRAARRVYSAWWSTSLWTNGWSRGSVMFFSLSSLIVLVWVIWETTGILSGYRYGNLWMGLLSIFINVGLFVCIMAFLSSGAASIVSRLNVGKGSEDHHQPNACVEFIQSVMISLLGSSSGIDKGPADADAWRGRLIFLQDEMARIAEESNEEANKRVDTIEKHVSQMESRLLNHLSGLETAIHALRSDLDRGDNKQEDEADPQLNGTNLSNFIESLLKSDKDLTPVGNTSI